MKGQISISQYLQEIKTGHFHCGACVCRSCLYWWSGRCPFGCCYDDKRAEENPYDKAHLDRPPRTAWSDWNKAGERAYWCRGGTFYPVRYCERFVKYKGCVVKECLEANVVVYQDGYIDCSLLENRGCEECYRRFCEKQKREDGEI